MIIVIKISIIIMFMNIIKMVSSLLILLELFEIDCIGGFLIEVLKVVLKFLCSLFWGVDKLFILLFLIEVGVVGFELFFLRV